MYVVGLKYPFTASTQVIAAAMKLQYLHTCSRGCQRGSGLYSCDAVCKINGLIHTFESTYGSSSISYVLSVHGYCSIVSFVGRSSWVGVQRVILESIEFEIRLPCQLYRMDVIDRRDVVKWYQKRITLLHKYRILISSFSIYYKNYFTLDSICVPYGLFVISKCDSLV